MKVYDTVNKLAEELRESDEYINLKKARELIKETPEYKDKIEKFQRMRYEEQLNSIQSGSINPEKIEAMNLLYEELIKIEVIKNYFEDELKFNILLGDVNKTISEAVKDVIE